MIVLLDNGHGITTPGKRSPDESVLEYAYTRKVVREAVRRLKAMGIDARALVPEDADIPLGERCNRVNALCDRVGKDNVCLVSVHLNAAGNGSQWMQATGWEAWTTKGQTQGDRLADCLYDSAEKVLRGMLGKWSPLTVRTDLTDGDRDKEADFTILYRSRCAACLTENFFMDNRSDAAWLLSDAGFDAVVRIHVEGIKEYVMKYS